MLRPPPARLTRRLPAVADLALEALAGLVADALEPECQRGVSDLARAIVSTLVVIAIVLLTPRKTERASRARSSSPRRKP